MSHNQKSHKGSVSNKLELKWPTWTDIFCNCKQCGTLNSMSYTKWASSLKHLASVVTCSDVRSRCPQAHLGLYKAALKGMTLDIVYKSWLPVL